MATTPTTSTALPLRTKQHRLADGDLARPERIRKVLIHDRDRRRSRMIVALERSAGHHTKPEHLEVVRSDGIDRRRRRRRGTERAQRATPDGNPKYDTDCTPGMRLRRFAHLIDHRAMRRRACARCRPC